MLSGMEGRPAGWYADPNRVGAARYWDGARWTDLVHANQVTYHDPTPITEVERAAARATAATVTWYLHDAASRGVLAADQAETLRRDVEARLDLTVAGPTVPVAPPPAPGTTPLPGPPPQPAAAPPQPAAAPPGPIPPAAQPVPVAPDRVGVWWSATRHAVRSDLALHGLAYLGVTLLFAGVIGLLVFSFGDVDPWVRSLTEVLMPIAPLASGWYLRRRGAEVVSAALTVLGGAVAPVVVAASLTDGAPFPPDIGGRALPIVQAVAVVAVAAAMVVATVRRASSPLRFLAAPSVWLAAGLAAGAARTVVPTGYAAARLDVLQLSMMLAALCATVWLAAWRRIPDALAGATRRIALPSAGALAVLELVLAAAAHWPAVATVLTGAALVLLLERATDTVPPPAIGALQLLVAAGTATRLLAHLERSPLAAGGTVALLALLEWTGRRRPDRWVATLGLLLAATALALTVGEAEAVAAAAAAVTAWGLWRYRSPAAWLPVHDRWGLVPAMAAVLTTGALWQLGSLGPAMVATAATVTALSALGRWWPPVGRDLLWRWFTPTAIGLVTLTSLLPAPGTLEIEIAVTAGLAAGAVVLTSLPAGLRAWATAALVAWSLGNVAAAIPLGRDTQVAVAATAAAVLVLGALPLRRPLGVHLLSIGHVAGGVAAALATWPGWSSTWTVVAATTAWVAVTVVDERSEAPHLAALRRMMGLVAAGPSTAQPGTTEPGTTEPGTSGSEPAGVAPVTVPDGVAPLLSYGGILLSTLLAVDLAGWVPFGDPRGTVAAAAVALVAAAPARLVPWRHAPRRLLASVPALSAWVAALLADAAVGADAGRWEPVLCLGAGLLLVGLMAAPRPRPIVWTAWASSALATAQLFDRCGLDRRWSDLVVAGWGAAVLLGALAAGRARRGPIALRALVTDRLLLPPTVLGAIGFVAGGLVGMIEPDARVVGWIAIALAAAMAAVALLAPLAALVAVAELLAVLGSTLVAPWEPMRNPWTFAPVALILLVAALATRRAPGAPWSLRRWDLPSFLVAHGVAALALLDAVRFDGVGTSGPTPPTTWTVPATYAAFAVLALAVAFVLRRRPWAAAGGVLALGAAADAGGGWPALVLLIEGVALTAVGLRARSRELRWGLVILGAAGVVGAWFELAQWRSWGVPTVSFATLAGSAVVVLVGALAIRFGRGPLELSGAWALTATVVSLTTAALTLDEVARRPGGVALAGMLAVLAAAAALTARALDTGPLTTGPLAVVGSMGDVLRWVAAGFATAAPVPFAWAVAASDAAMSVTGSGLALAGFVAGLLLHARRPAGRWLGPVAGAAIATEGLALVPAWWALPRHDLLIVVLVAVVAELVATAVIVGRPELHVLAPLPALAAWLLYAADTLAGNPNWFTIPIGLTVLVMAGLVRWIRRARGGDPAGADVVAIELLAMSCLVAWALAEVVAGRLWNGLLAVGVGVALAGWGIATRVLWRVRFGAAAVVVTVVLLIGVPLSGAITWRGVSLWITLGAIGICAIAAAAAIDSGRDRMRGIAHQLDEMTGGWERFRIRRS